MSMSTVESLSRMELSNLDSGASPSPTMTSIAAARLGTPRSLNKASTGTCMVTNGSVATISGIAPFLALVMYRYNDDVDRILRSCTDRISHCMAKRDGCLTAKTYGVLWCNFSCATSTFSTPPTMK